MRTSVTVSYPADAERTAAMLASPEFQRGRIEGRGLSDVSVDVAPRGRGHVTTLRGAVPVDRLPAAAARFVRGAVAFEVLESWGEPADDGSRTGSLEVTVKGAPVRAAGTLHLVPEGAATTQDVDLDFSVNVPLVGRRIEQKALGYVNRVLRDEETRAAAWLAAHP